MSKRRLDEVAVERGLFENRSQARALILAGKVRVNDQVVSKAGFSVEPESEITVEEPPPYVSRGGFKLRQAMETFDIKVDNYICADFGASTGGFTDVLLQSSAQKVYAIDVGYGQLHWNLQKDERVIIMDRTNARYITELPDPIDLVVVDVSFISLEHMFPAAAHILKPEGGIVALVKPQFEAGRGQVRKGGVVKERKVHRQVLLESIERADRHGFQVLGLDLSPITGPAGNREFLLYARRADELTNVDELGIKSLLDRTHSVGETKKLRT